jgi:protein involved in polysaccharide export with SLBB domain
LLWLGRSILAFQDMVIALRKLALTSLICLILAATAGCASKRLSEANLPVDLNWTAEDYKYRLSAGDELGLRFVLNPDLNSQVTIGSDGRGVFPLVQGVKLAGLTVEEANATLSKAYSSYLRKPIVELLIYNYLGGNAYVAGEVKLPGMRNIHGELSVTQVINDVGGFTDAAKVVRVILLRRRPGPEGHYRVLMKLVNVNGIYQGKIDQDVRVLPGDVIYVPRSNIAEVDRIVRQYITNVLPFSTNYQLNTQGLLNPAIR